MALLGTMMGLTGPNQLIEAEKRREQALVKFVGGVELVGGILMSLTGYGLAVRGSGILARMVGTALLARGADHIETGISTTKWGDPKTPTYEKGLEKLGLPPHVARVVGFATDMALGLAIPFAKSGQALGPTKGGSYRQVRAANKGGQVHHMPAKEASPISKENGPAIWMESNDHMKTASYGNSRPARAYRRRQQQLIEQGRMEEAIQMDIDDVRDLFGNKYDEAINQMLEYARRQGIIQ